jgi:putative peptidoglycan lipid II flippase
MKSNELFRASGIMALGTILSRITGFIRGILIVAVLGTALLADTYNVANTMPNILYNLLCRWCTHRNLYSTVSAIL